MVDKHSATPTAELLRQSREYRYMIEQQHAAARHNYEYHKRKAAEAEEEASWCEHQIATLKVEERRFIERLAKEDGTT